MAALLALLSSLMWGTADFLGGTLTRSRPALLVVAASQAVGLALMLVIATAAGAWSAPVTYLPWAVGASLTGFTGLVLFYSALASGTMGIVSPIAALGVLVPLGVGLLSGDRPMALQYLGILVAIVGIVLASGPEVSGGTGVRPVVLALGAALMFGLSLTCIAFGSDSSPLMTMTAMRATSVSVGVVALLVTRTPRTLTVRELPGIAAVGALDVSANVAYGVATTTGLVSVVSVLGSLYPVVTVLLAWWLLRERLSPPQYAGVAAALVGVALISAGGG